MILRWRLLLIFTAFVLLSGAILALLLSLGLADPPRAGTLQWQAKSIAEWPTRKMNDVMIYEAPVQFNRSFTLEITAQNNGARDSAWGFALPDAEAQIIMLVSHEGYYTFNPRYSPWQEFQHIMTDEANTINFHVTQDGHGTIRINDEIVHDTLSFSFYSLDSWGIATYGDPQLTWERIALYHE